MIRKIDWWQTNLDAWRAKGPKAGVFFAFCNWDRVTADQFGYYGLRRADGRVERTSVRGTLVGMPIDVSFTEEVVRLGPGDVVHEVEEVAALLHQGAASVLVEPVPVVDFDEKWKPMLSDRDHLCVLVLLQLLQPFSWDSW